MEKLPTEYDLDVAIAKYAFFVYCTREQTVKNRGHILFVILM